MPNTEKTKQPRYTFESTPLNLQMLNILQYFFKNMTFRFLCKLAITSSLKITCFHTSISGDMLPFTPVGVVSDD